MSLLKLKRAFAKADRTDRAEGMLAYFRYHALMRELSEMYACPLDRTVAVFVSLSPNSSYHQNLRGAVSVLKAVQEGVPVADVNVSTYRHCLLRAYAYAIGEAAFVTKNRGPKVLNFYHNVLTPEDPRWVTVDGHMSALWQGKRLTMRDALISLRQYRVIAHDIKRLAFSEFMLPQQMQAILWFVRKRTLKIGYQPQTNLFQLGDQWRTAIHANDIEPYAFGRMGPEQLDGLVRVSDIRRPGGANAGAVQRLLFPKLRNSRRGRLSIAKPISMEPPVFAKQETLLSSADSSGDHRERMEVRRNGEADAAASNGDAVSASSDHGPDGNSQAVAETLGGPSRRQATELPP